MAHSNGFVNTFLVSIELFFESPHIFRTVTMGFCFPRLFLVSSLEIVPILTVTALPQLLVTTTNSVNQFFLGMLFHMDHLMTNRVDELINTFYFVQTMVNLNHKVTVILFLITEPFGTIFVCLGQQDSDVQGTVARQHLLQTEPDDLLGQFPVFLDTANNFNTNHLNLLLIITIHILRYGDDIVKKNRSI